MKQKQHITAFYLETLLLILVFVGIILVITQVFGIGKAESSEAKLLTNAVTLASNAAEAFYAAEDDTALIALLDENGNAFPLPDGGNGAIAYYNADMTPNPEPGYRLIVRVDWTADRDMQTGTVTVTNAAAEPIYTLPIAKPVGEVAP